MNATTIGNNTGTGPSQLPIRPIANNDPKGAGRINGAMRVHRPIRGSGITLLERIVIALEK